MYPGEAVEVLEQAMGVIENLGFAIKDRAQSPPSTRAHREDLPHLLSKAALDGGVIADLNGTNEFLNYRQVCLR